MDPNSHPDHKTNQPNNQPTNQPTNQPANQPANQPTTQPSPLVSDPAPILTSNPFPALAGLACEDEKAATNVVTSFNRKTRAGKGKRRTSRSPSPSVRKTPRRSKEAEAPAIAVANLVAEPEVGRSETVETEEASVQPALPTR